MTYTTRRTGPGETLPWSRLQEQQPQFAAEVEQRFLRHRHHVLATLRADGSPRLSGLEVAFRDGELWLGLMPGSRKARDLRRDPRFALHAHPGSGTEEEMAAAGDARISGRAEETTDPADLARYAAGGELPETFHLFRTGITEVVRTRLDLEGEPEMVLET